MRKSKRRALLKRELAEESMRVRENSMEILSLYEQLEDEIIED